MNVDGLVVDRSDGIVTLTIDRPERKNAITGDMWQGLVEIFEEIALRNDDRVLVITGGGDAFCSGADLTSAARNKQMLHSRFFDRTRSQALLNDMLSRA